MIVSHKSLGFLRTETGAGTGITVVTESENERSVLDEPARQTFSRTYWSPPY